MLTTRKVFDDATLTGIGLAFESVDTTHKSRFVFEPHLPDLNVEMSL